MSLRTTIAALSAALRRMQNANGSHVVTKAGTILDYAPHLELHEADAIMRVPGRHYFIGPPTAVRGAEHVYCYDGSGTEKKVLYVGVHRRKESYAAKFNQVPEGWEDKQYEYRERAADFAEIHWGDQLTWDRARCHILCQFLHPDQATADGQGLRSSGFIKPAMISFDATFIDLAALSPAVPIMARMHEHLYAVHTEVFSMMELLGNELPMGAFFCAYCGGGLLEKECSHCKRRCVGGMAGRVEWPWPVPPPLLEAPGVIDRSVFLEDPVHAIKAAYAKWAMDGYESPPTASTIGHRERVVQLRSEDE